MRPLMGYSIAAKPETMSDMADEEDVLTIRAVAILRGDLPRLRKGTYIDLDAAFAKAMADEDAATAASLIRQVAEDSRLGAWLHEYEDYLAQGAITTARGPRDINAFQGLPGALGAEFVTIWTCPEAPPGHLRRIQHGRPEDVGSCTEHHVPLVRENPDT